jgi:hypothetical protein
MIRAKFGEETMRHIQKMAENTLVWENVSIWRCMAT